MSRPQGKESVKNLPTMKKGTPAFDEAEEPEDLNLAAASLKLDQRSVPSSKPRPKAAGKDAVKLLPTLKPGQPYNFKFDDDEETPPPPPPVVAPAQPQPTASPPAARSNNTGNIVVKEPDVVVVRRVVQTVQQAPQVQAAPQAAPPKASPTEGMSADDAALYQIVGGPTFERLKKNDPKLKKLDIEAKELGEEGARVIGQMLLWNTSLQILILEDNAIGDSGFVHIVNALKQNRTLTTLHVGNNNMTNSGAGIATLLESNSTLTSLNIEGNKLGVAGARLIAKALIGNKSLKRLYIGYNWIEEDGALAFARALDTNTSLGFLHFGDDVFPEELSRKLVNQIKRNAAHT